VLFSPKYVKLKMILTCHPRPVGILKKTAFDVQKIFLKTTTTAQEAEVGEETVLGILDNVVRIRICESVLC
jgi:hypothetical protein